jgi:ribosomal protein S18 acetylase RimI-like enzyme
MLIRRLTPSDAAAFQALRLRGLQESPTAFSSSYEEECDRPLEVVAAKIAPEAGRAVFGAHDGDELVGLIGVGIDGGRKLAHKRIIWGMYVAPSHRGCGIGSHLMQQALEFAATIPGVRQVTLGVNAENTAARRLYESAGFEIYGLEPAALLVDGELHDEMWMIRKLDGKSGRDPGTS